MTRTHLCVRSHGDLCLGVELAINKEDYGPLPPVPYRACHLQDGSDDTRVSEAQA